MSGNIPGPHQYLPTALCGKGHDSPIFQARNMRQKLSDLPPKPVNAEAVIELGKIQSFHY